MTNSVPVAFFSPAGPPQPPYLQGYSEGVGIHVGTQQQITCISRGANPPADLQWYRNGQKIPSQKHSVEDMSSAEIEIVAEPQDNGAQYRCEAHNSAASTPVSVSTTLVVHFPPEAVKVRRSPVLIDDYLKFQTLCCLFRDRISLSRCPGRISIFFLCVF